MATTNYYKNWYEKNKDRLKEKRRQTYHSDPEYRQRRLESSYRQRDRSRKLLSTGLEVNFSQASLEIGVSFGTLREWGRKSFFPEPIREGGRMWFTKNQVLLLKRLSVFFNENGSRVTSAKKVKLDELVNFIYANW